jgi:N-ethylmaleimide reductase
MHKLYSPIAIGPIALSHRIVHAPMSRLRSSQQGDVPGRLMATRYRQCASSGGLQIAEAASVSLVGRGCRGTPGIHSEAQIQGWRRVTDAAHAQGGRIFLQLLHVGRQSHVDITGGPPPVAPSAIPCELVVLTKDGWVPASPARALTTHEIPDIVAQFHHGAIRARAAGFDGVEIHGANGYLIDQFIQDRSNKRTDRYGGSIKKRARFLLEVVEAVSSAWGSDRVGVRLGPSGTSASMRDSDPVATFA